MRALPVDQCVKVEKVVRDFLFPLLYLVPLQHNMGLLSQCPIVSMPSWRSLVVNLHGGLKVVFYCEQNQCGGVDLNQEIPCMSGCSALLCAVS